MRAILIAYHFPPLGGPGAQRSLNFARHLALQGFEVTVITGPGTSEDFWAPADPGSQHLVGSAITVLRTSIPEPRPGSIWRRRQQRLLPISDVFGTWFEDAVVRCLSELGSNPDVLLGQLVPYESGRALQAASDRLGVPWVADLLDPWALDEMWLYPSAVQRSMDRRRMRTTLESAARVIMNTPEAAKRTARGFPSIADRVVSIPSGYEASDFEHPEPSREDGTFDIVHTGSMHTVLGLRHRRTQTIRRLLGGMPVANVDFLPRSHVFLIRALERLFARKPETRQAIRVHLAGAMTETDREIAAHATYVKLVGFLPHTDTIALIRSADLLFLPMHNLPGRAGLVPTKTYEYIGSGRPILAAVPEGDARDLLRETGTATVVRPDDVDAISWAIDDAYTRWRNAGPEPAPRWEVIRRYEYGRLTRQVADVLRDVGGGAQRPD